VYTPVDLPGGSTSGKVVMSTVTSWLFVKNTALGWKVLVVLDTVA